MLTLTFSFTQDKKVWPSTETSLSIGLLKTRQLTFSFAAVITALATRGRQPALNSVMGHEKHPAQTTLVRQPRECSCSHSLKLPDNFLLYFLIVLFMQKDTRLNECVCILM